MRNRKAEIGERELQEVLDLLRKASDEKDLFRRLFSDLFTPNELKELATRLQILKQLSAGVSQRAIAEELHTSIATITRGSRVLTNPRSGIHSVSRNWRPPPQRASAA